MNTIKPQLIAESTKNARIAGDKFANDSQAKLGKIKHLKDKFLLQDGIRMEQQNPTNPIYKKQE